MQINGTLRKIIPICSMLLALGTIAFQNIENSANQEKEEQHSTIETREADNSVQVSNHLIVKED